MITYGSTTLANIRDGEDGTSVTITSTSIKYQKGTSGTTKPTGTWQTSIPSIGENEYLWTQTIVNYSDGSKTEAYSVSRNAKNGTSPTVSSTVVEYQQSTGGITPPTGTWSSTAPTATAGQYMWTKTTITYSDGKTAVSYSVSKNGTNGVSVTNVTSTNNTADGGTSVVTITLSDGTTKTFNVKNGTKGTTGATAQWYYGTSLIHTSGTATLVATSTSGAVVGSMYLNTQTSLVYKCTAVGTNNTWTYAGDLTTGVIDNIEIGGRNLVRDTADWKNCPYAGDTATVSGEEFIAATTTGTNWRRINGWFTKTKEDIYSSSIVISFDVKKSDETPLSELVFQLFTTNKAYKEQTSGNLPEGSRYYINLANSIWKNTENVNKDTWTRVYSIPIIMQECFNTTSYTEYDYLAFYIGVKAATSSASFRHLKIELGNKVTDWTPAPEDTDASIQQVQDNLDNLEIGGRNLLYNSATMPAISNGLKGWRASGGTVTHIDLTNPPIYNITGAIRVTNTGSSVINIGIAQDKITNKFITGEKYTQSCWVRASETLRVYLSPIWASSGQATGGSPSVMDYFSIGTEWTYIKWEGAVLKGEQATSYSAGYVYAYQAPTSSWFEVCGMKLEKGAKATDWTPAPEDTQADIDTALAQSIWYATCSTTGATLLKEATITPITTNFKLGIGTAVNVKFDNTNSGARTSLTLNVNNTGAKNIKFINNNTITDIPGNGYILGGRTYLFIYDGTYWVIQNLNYNSNETNHVLNNFSGKTGELGIWQTGLFMKDGKGTYQNICTNNAGAVTRTAEYTKKANTKGFEIGSSIYFSPSNTYGANANITGAVYASYGAFDSRYSLNAEGANALTAYMPIYLTGTINDVDGLFHLDTIWWTQTPTDPDKVYVLIGGCYDYYHATSADYWRITLYEQNNWYKYVDETLVDYSNNLAELAATTATAFIAVDTDNNGIMVHPEDDMASGWQIGDAIQLFKNGISYIRMWIQDNIPKIRIGDEDKNHIVIDDEAIRFYGEDSNDETKELATYSTDGITFDPETSYKIGNNNSYISFEDEDNSKKLKIVADSIEFTNTGDVQKQLDDLQGNLDLRDQYIRIDTGDAEATPPVSPSITIAASLDGEATNLKLESDKLSFQVNGQPTATMTNDKMNIPTASVTNLFMESSGHQKIWVIRENGHLSLKAGKIME